MYKIIVFIFLIIGIKSDITCHDPILSYLFDNCETAGSDYNCPNQGNYTFFPVNFTQVDQVTGGAPEVEINTGFSHDPYDYIQNDTTKYLLYDIWVDPSQSMKFQLYNLQFYFNEGSNLLNIDDGFGYDHNCYTCFDESSGVHEYVIIMTTENFVGNPQFLFYQDGLLKYSNGNFTLDYSNNKPINFDGFNIEEQFYKAALYFVNFDGDTILTELFDNRQGYKSHKTNICFDDIDCDCTNQFNQLTEQIEILYQYFDDLANISQIVLLCNQLSVQMNISFTEVINLLNVYITETQSDLSQIIILLNDLSDQLNMNTTTIIELINQLQAMTGYNFTVVFSILESYSSQLNTTTIFLIEFLERMENYNCTAIMQMLINNHESLEQIIFLIENLETCGTCNLTEIFTLLNQIIDSQNNTAEIIELLIQILNKPGLNQTLIIELLNIIFVTNVEHFELIFDFLNMMYFTTNATLYEIIELLNFIIDDTSIITSLNFLIVHANLTITQINFILEKLETIDLTFFISFLNGTELTIVEIYQNLQIFFNSTLTNIYQIQNTLDEGLCNCSKIETGLYTIENGLCNCSKIETRLDECIDTLNNGLCNCSKIETRLDECVDNRWLLQFCINTTNIDVCIAELTSTLNRIGIYDNFFFGIGIIGIIGFAGLILWFLFWLCCIKLRWLWGFSSKQERYKKVKGEEEEEY